MYSSFVAVTASMGKEEKIRIRKNEEILQALEWFLQLGYVLCSISKHLHSNIGIVYTKGHEAINMQHQNLPSKYSTCILFYT